MSLQRFRRCKIQAADLEAAMARCHTLQPRTQQFCPYFWLGARKPSILLTVRLCKLDLSVHCHAANLVLVQVEVAR